MILAKANIIVDNIQSGKGTIGQLINNPDLYNKVPIIPSMSLEKLEKNLNAGRGSIGKLMTDDSLYNRLNDTVAKLDDIAAGIDSGKGTAGKLLKDEPFITI